MWLNRYFHSRNCTAAMFLIAVVLTYIAYDTGHVTDITGSRGPVFPSPNTWLAPGVPSLVISLALMALTAIIYIALNKTYNFMRAPSALAATLYIAMLASLPLAAGQFYGGSMLCVVMLGVTAMLFSCYGDTGQNRRIFLIFFMMALAATVQYAFMFYIVVMIPGMAQMKILNLRSVLAMLMGIVCPIWILYAFDMLDFSDIGWPQFASTFSRLSLPGMVTVFVAVGVTMILGFAAMCANIVKVLGYNAKYRAYNGFLSLLLLATMLFVVVDYQNLSVYFPLLCLLSANQIGHYFSIRQSRASQWIILSVICLYMLIYSACYIEKLW